MKNLWNTIVHAITRFFSLIFERFGKKKAILLIVSGSVVLLSAIITPFFFVFGEDEPDDPHTCVGITWVIDNDATCTAEGSKRFVCSCGKTVKTEKIPLAPHTEENVPGKAATCTEKGLTDGKKCSVCGETLVEQQVISALGHSFENGVCIRCGDDGSSSGGGEGPGTEVHTCVGVRWEITQAATFKQTGIKALVCSCGKTVRTDTIPLVAHTEQTVPGRAATCKQTGLTAGKKCSVCGETLVAQTEIPLDSNAHNMVDGVCTLCGYSYSTEIRTVTDLQNIASNLSGNYILMNDLDLGGMEWTPIGKDDNNPFTGTFDGNGHVIKNFKITGNRQYAGLFGYSQGTIQNIGLENFTINVSRSGTIYAGGLVGYNSGTITNCYATGDVSASASSTSTSSSAYAYAGGLVGYNGSSNATTNTNITNCYATGDVSASASSTSTSSSAYAYAGGLVGRNYGTITNCYATGDVSASSTSTNSNAYACAGSLVGYRYSGTITNCYRYSGQSFTVTKNGTTTYSATNTVGVATSIENLQSKAWVEENLWKAEIEIWSFGSGYPTLDYEVIDALMQSEIEISTKEEIMALQGCVLVRNYKLMADIDLGGMKWQPIAIFIGTFDGNGHVIENFKITGDVQYAGLFGYSKGTIQNIGLENFTIDVSCSGNIYAGGLVGYNSGTITNCYATGDVSASSTSTSSSAYAYAGGLVGYNGSSNATTNTNITNCYATGDVSASASSTSTSSFAYAYAGGLVGENYGSNATITHCYAMGDVSASSTNSSAYAGGLVGENYNATITNCYATGAVSASNTSTDYYVYVYAGGLVGENYNATITNCYATGDVSASSTSTRSNAYAGGLVGENFEGTITNCYATGAVSATASSTSTSSSAYAHAGGLVGENNYGSTITNCYATGDVSASSTNSNAHAGGLVGYNYGSNASITNSYATGDVSASGTSTSSSAYAYAGGLVGYNYGTITNCYRYSGQSFTVTRNGTTTYSATNAEGTAKDMATLQSVDFQQNTLLWSAGGWNFSAGAHPTLKNVGLEN